MNDIITMAMIVLMTMMMVVIVTVVMTTIMTAVRVIGIMRSMSGMVSMSAITNVIVYVVICVISRRMVGWIVGTDSHGFTPLKFLIKGF